MAYCLTTDWWHQPHCLLGQSNQETTISFLIVLSSATFGQKTPLLLDPQPNVTLDNFTNMANWWQEITNNKPKKLLVSISMV